MSDDWILKDTEKDNEREFESRSKAEDAKEEMEELGADVELIPPSKTDGGSQKATVVETPEEDPRGTVTTPQPDEELEERSVAEDPLNWVPGSFVDEIDGTQAINRKGFEVLSHFYDVDVETDVEIGPTDTDFEYCQVKAVATTADGRHCEAYGSAHVDRDDDSHLLLEMADTRARKRALSIATGVGAVAVEELKNEVER